MSKLLINEQPLMFSPTLAIELGKDIPAAVFMQQLHFWLSVSRNVHDNKKWVWNTQNDWADDVMRGVVCPRTIRNIINKLIERNLIEVSYLHPDKWNRTAYYTINYPELSKLDEKYSQVTDITHVEDVATCIRKDLPHPSGRCCHMFTEEYYRRKQTEYLYR